MFPVGTCCKVTFVVTSVCVMLMFHVLPVIVSLLHKYLYCYSSMYIVLHILNAINPPL